MINLIIGAVSASLYAEFGAAYKIYAEDVEQGLSEPCFFVSCVSHSQELYFGKRYRWESMFCISYLPARGQQAFRECHEAAERLALCLEYIDIPEGKLRGTKMHYEMADGVLHFFVNYNCFVRQEAGQQEAIEGMESHTDVKG